MTKCRSGFAIRYNSQQASELVFALSEKEPLVKYLLFHGVVWCRNGIVRYAFNNAVFDCCKTISFPGLIGYLQLGLGTRLAVSIYAPCVWTC